MVLADATKDVVVLTIDPAGAFTLGGAQSFLFDFTGSLTEGLTYALIATETDLSAYLDKFKSNYGNDFAYADGKLMFTAGAPIPEPATYAALFAVLSLAFVAYRRRK